MPFQFWAESRPQFGCGSAFLQAGCDATMTICGVVSERRVDGCVNGTAEPAPVVWAERYQQRVYRRLAM